MCPRNELLHTSGFSALHGPRTGGSASRSGYLRSRNRSGGWAEERLWEATVSPLAVPCALQPIPAAAPVQAEPALHPAVRPPRSGVAPARELTDRRRFGFDDCRGDAGTSSCSPRRVLQSATATPLWDPAESRAITTRLKATERSSPQRTVVARGAPGVITGRGSRSRRPRVEDCARRVRGNGRDPGERGFTIRRHSERFIGENPPVRFQQLPGF